MGTVMLRQPMRGMLAFRYLSGVSSMMRHDRLNRLAVFRHAFHHRLIVSEIVAHAIPRENLGCDEARAHIPAVITQDEFVEAGLPRRPIFFRRDEDRFSRCARRSAKNKGVDAIALEDLDIRQLARSFFHHDSGKSASGKANGKQDNKEKFKAHRYQIETDNRVVGLSNPAG